MKEKPILFNTAMVRAILDGRKTVTRRVVKREGYDDIIHNPKNNYAHNRNDGYWSIGYDARPIRGWPQEAVGVKAPYRIGDILWVRETWRLVDFDFIDTDWSASVQYKADMAIGERWHDLSPDERTGWRPSIHMPREAARIFLRVTDVRVERLQKIDENGAIAEGCSAGRFETTGGPWGVEDNPDEWTAREDFSRLWDSTIKRADLNRYGWSANPWVWVIAFERIERPVSGE